MTAAAAATVAGRASPPLIHLLGPAWTRSFRCVWMLEELQPLPYTMVKNTMPTSRHVRQFVSTGKVPVLLEYDNTVANNGEDSVLPDAVPSFVLSESSAINTYLADQYGGAALGLIPPLIASSTSSGYTEISEPQQHQHQQRLLKRNRAKYDALVSCITTELDAQGLWIHRKHEAMGEHFGKVPAAVRHARDYFARINDYLCTTFLFPTDPSNVSSSSSTTTTAMPSYLPLYLMGDTFTAADILYVHCLDWSKAIGWDETWPKRTLTTAPDFEAAMDQRTTILQDYIHRCHSRPAYQRAVALRDANRNRSSGSTAGGCSKL